MTSSGVKTRHVRNVIMTRKFPAWSFRYRLEAKVKRNSMDHRQTRGPYIRKPQIDGKQKPAQKSVVQTSLTKQKTSVNHSSTPQCLHSRHQLSPVHDEAFKLQVPKQQTLQHVSSRVSVALIASRTSSRQPHPCTHACTQASGMISHVDHLLVIDHA